MVILTTSFLQCLTKALGPPEPALHQADTVAMAKHGVSITMLFGCFSVGTGGRKQPILQKFLKLFHDRVTTHNLAQQLPEAQTSKKLQIFVCMIKFMFDIITF